jgi:hypothetical protein
MIKENFERLSAQTRKARKAIDENDAEKPIAEANSDDRGAGADAMFGEEELEGGIANIIKKSSSTLFIKKEEEMNSSRRVDT